MTSTPGPLRTATNDRDLATADPLGIDDATVLLPPMRSTVARRHPPKAAPSGARTSRRPPRRRRPSVDTLLSCALTVLVLGFLLWNITGYPTASDDEGTYLAQAWAVQHGQGLAHYTYWYDHPPLGWIQLAAASWIPATLLPDALAVGAGRLAMLPVVAVSLILVYRLGRRLGFTRWAAALALLLYGFSPLSMTMMRQIYLDSFAVMWILAALVLGLSPRRHLWHYVAAGVAVALAVLSKETIVVVAPAVVLALWQNAARTSTRPWALGGFVSGVVLVGAFYPLYAMLKGELLPGDDHVSLISAWQFQLAHRAGSGSILAPDTNSNELLTSWLYYDTVLPLGGMAATLVALAVRRLRTPAVAAALLALVALRPGGYLPAMYVVQALPFFAIVLAGVIELVVGWVLAIRKQVTEGARVRPRLLRWAALTLAVLLAAAYVAPRWYEGDRRALVSDDNATYRAAASWLRRAMPDRPHTTVVVDDVLWLDLVTGGYRRDRVIWFYKLDLDPAVAARLPDGWRGIDYIVSTPAVRQDPESLPTVAALLSHSTVVQAFGSGSDRIEIRRISKEAA